MKESAWPLISTTQSRLALTYRLTIFSGVQNGERERMASHFYRTKQTSSHVQVNNFSGVQHGERERMASHFIST